VQYLEVAYNEIMTYKNETGRESIYLVFGSALFKFCPVPFVLFSSVFVDSY
jgi:hypothetical protein